MGNIDIRRVIGGFHVMRLNGTEIAKEAEEAYRHGEEDQSLGFMGNPVRLECFIVYGLQARGIG